MKIVVEMTPEEFTDYWAYQRDRALLEEKQGDQHRMETAFNHLCDIILSSVEAPTLPAEPPLPPGVLVKDERKLLEAIELASNWLYL